MSLIITRGFGDRHLIPTWGYGRETLEGGTQITQLYKEFDFDFDVSFEIKRELKFITYTKIFKSSTEEFDVNSIIPVESKNQLPIHSVVRLEKDTVHSIELQKEISYSFNITSSLSHKCLIRVLNALG